MTTHDMPFDEPPATDAPLPHLGPPVYDESPAPERESKRAVGVNRREPRYHVNPEFNIRVAVRRAAMPNQEISGKVVDMSQSGARLVLESSVQFQEAITVYLVCEEMGLDIALSSNVCWLRQGRGPEEWVLGCAFDPELPADYLEDFFRNGLLERRSNPRLPLDMEARALWELSNEPAPIRLVNVSQCGFCMTTSNMVEVGRRVRLFVDRANRPELQIDGRIQWAMRNGEEQVLGCHLVNTSGYDSIGELAAIAEASMQPQGKPKPEPLSAWRLLFYTALTALVALVATWLAWWRAGGAELP